MRSPQFGSGPGFNYAGWVAEKERLYKAHIALRKPGWEMSFCDGRSIDEHCGHCGRRKSDPECATAEAAREHFFKNNPLPEEVERMRFLADQKNYSRGEQAS